MNHGEQLLESAVAEAFDSERRGRLLERLDADPPMREDVLQLLAKFRVDPSPFFLSALLEILEGRRDAAGEEPVMAAMRIALALPALELGEAVCELDRR